MGFVAIKSAFCIFQSNVIVQLISPFVFAAQRVQSLYSINTKFQASIHLLYSCTARFVSDLVENAKDRFSYKVADMGLIVSKPGFKIFNQVRHKPISATKESS